MPKNLILLPLSYILKPSEDIFVFFDLKIDLLELIAVWFFRSKTTFSVTILKSSDLKITFFLSKILSLSIKSPSFAVTNILFSKLFIANLGSVISTFENSLISKTNSFFK